MRTLLGVLLAAMTAGGCSVALDMDRFGRGGEEKVVLNDTNQPRSGPLDDRREDVGDAGDAGAPPTEGDPTPKPNEPDAGPTASQCTIREQEPNNSDVNAQQIGPGVLCGTLLTDKDQDRFDFASAAPFTIRIEGSPNVTVQVFRNGTELVTHTGAAERTAQLEAGSYEIWVHGVEPGLKPYRITLK